MYTFHALGVQTSTPNWIEPLTYIPKVYMLCRVLGGELFTFIIQSPSSLLNSEHTLIRFTNYKYIIYFTMLLLGNVLELGKPSTTIRK